MQPQTKEQRGKRACALTAGGSISKAMKGLVRRALSGSAECGRLWTTALIPRSSGQGTQATQAAWGATGDIPEECRFLLNTQLMFPENERDRTTKIFDGDEWIRSLTEAQERPAVIPEERITHDQS